MSTIVFLTTSGGIKYARKIGKKVIKLGHHYFLCKANDYPRTHILHPDLNPENTLIHPRVAYPYKTGWVEELSNKVDEGYRVINSLNTIMLTANKLQCGIMLNRVGIPHPETFVVDKHNLRKVYDTLKDGKYVIKPLTSMSQGEHVKKIIKPLHSFEEFERIFNTIPGNTKFMQEFIFAHTLHRVIVLNNVALPFTFIDRTVDKNDDWKLSVCLNKKTMKFVNSISNELRKIAEDTQRFVRGVVNFIDVFETENYYVVSEINTACNLSIHERLSGYDIAGDIAKTLVEQL